jgi:hypothetical protein
VPERLFGHVCGGNAHDGVAQVARPYEFLKCLVFPQLPAFVVEVLVEQDDAADPQAIAK